MIRLARAYLHLGILAVALFGAGCATTRTAIAIVKCAVPTATQLDQIFTAASTSADPAIAAAAIDLLDFALCVKQAAADKEIATLTPNPDAGAVAAEASEYSPALDNLRAWRAANP